MVRVQLDPEGRLIRFLAVPPQQDSREAAAPPVNWTPLFEAAGLDRSRWSETPSQEIPMFGFDERKAWAGSYAHAPNMPLRIEAAAWKGRPVSFELFGPWRLPVRVQRPTAARTRQAWILESTLLLLLLTSDFSAWYASRGRTAVALTLALAVWSFRNALGGRKVLSERFLDA